MSTLSSGLVERVVNVLPQLHFTVHSMYSGWIPCFMSGSPSSEPWFPTKAKTSLLMLSQARPNASVCAQSGQIRPQPASLPPDPTGCQGTRAGRPAPRRSPGPSGWTASARKSPGIPGPPGPRRQVSPETPRSPGDGRRPQSRGCLRRRSRGSALPRRPWNARARRRPPPSPRPARGRTSRRSRPRRT